MSGPAESEPLCKADLAYLGDIVHSGGVGFVNALPLSSIAFLALEIRRRFDVPVICATDGPKTQDILYSDLLTLGGGSGEAFAFYPGWESLPLDKTLPQADLVGDRFQTLIRLLHGDSPDVTITTIQALMQRTVAPEHLRDGTQWLAAGKEIEIENMTAHLERWGYDFRPELSVKGEAALRGGLLDIWPLTEPWPLRIEFFGSVIESIRRFDPLTQRSIDRRESVVVTPAVEIGRDEASRLRGDFFDFLPRACCWIWVDGQSIEHHAAVYQETIAELQAGAFTMTYQEACDRTKASCDSGWISTGDSGGDSDETRALSVSPIEGIPALPDTAAGTPDLLERERSRFIEALAARQEGGEELRFYFSTQGSRDRFIEYQREAHPGLIEKASIHVGRLSEGFHLPGSGLTVVAENDIYGRRKELRGRYDLHARRKGPPRRAGDRVAEWTDLRPGELVVHADHGIGEYLGLQELEFHGERQEVLAIRYAENARLYIPVGQSQMLNRYVGIGGKPPRLHRIGGRRWKSEKTKAERSMRDLAGTMLETQATRELNEGFTFGPDTPWQIEFEATFPYEETPDQDRAIREVKEDMERARPMERLVCGDVGYGKTEVAMRAAFKAVMDGKQVALLVPTTVLAQQHYDTFSSRMAAFPFAVAMLSRFQTRGTQTEIVRRVKEGAIDIVIGTHRLLQKDIAFKDLGLLIIDEEQRFGVEQKESIKRMRSLVDVLTLTATPIPRTLYMSLLGAKDMSTIQSPPLERLPVETRVEAYTDEIVRQAILRELNREGQVFYLHNRVLTIDRVAERIEALVPEARIAVAHGQMHERELAAVMRAFVGGEYDVLLCTTIIESGVDIPNVNTIIIDRADRFGLSDLYQLRGRVGRYKHKAYAYLMLPRHGRLLDTARQRIGALRRYGGLGAGFKLALKDLEIRGAGNLLGSEQSGHISAIGFELYCQFLKRTVARMKGEEVPPLIDVELKLDFISFATGDADEEFGVVIPTSYIEDEDVRVHAYRKVATVASEADVRDLFAEFADRFGPIPPALNRLLKIALVRALAAERDIHAIETRDEKIMMTRNGDYIKDGRLFPRFDSDHPYKRLEELVEVVRKVSPSGAQIPMHVDDGAANVDVRPCFHAHSISSLACRRNRLKCGP